MSIPDTGRKTVPGYMLEQHGRQCGWSRVSGKRRAVRTEGGVRGQSIQGRGWQTFSFKDQVRNTLGFSSHKVPTIQLCLCSANIATDLM